MSDAKSKDSEVIILLALYNGAKNIEAQLQSIARQTHKEWSLIVSDDGSVDQGPEIVRQFCKAHPDKKITLMEGPKSGFVANFLALLSVANPNAPFIALSDQDDIWLEGKIERAITMLRKLPEDTPALYCSRTCIWNEHLEASSLSTLFPKPPSFQNALVQNIASGNTMVFNNTTLEMLQAASPTSADTACHDWWIYQMVSGAGGAVIYDTAAFIKYRQHSENLIGANNTTRASLSRVGMMMKGYFKSWNTRNIATLQANDKWLTPESRAVLAQFVVARNTWLLPRIIGIYKSGINRQTLKGNIGLILAVLMGKI
ncbi:MAG: glycosyltransferase family 2 protein [Amylibacter sp.]|nr:glycosyltransferase family 2 protein [Amylibacter sp.]